MSSPELVSRAWMLSLALTVALLAVAVMRPVCRRWLGAERSFQLWLLPPLAVLVSLLPHSTGIVTTPLPMLVLTVTTAVDSAGTAARHGAGMHWQDAVLLLWILGVVAGMTATGAAQRRYMRLVHEGTRLDESHGRWTVWRAARDDIGPALVGAWRPRIVVPADFERRYSDDERALILAHEAIHAARHDGWWSLCARALLITLWCNPLAWWAYRAFQLDQELACDAAVMRSHQQQRYLYAQTMLKTQSAAWALPVGCSWSPRHPITERIAMLKLSSPGKARRIAGRIIMLALWGVVAGSLYAATDTQSPANGDHRLKIELGVNGEPARLHANICLGPGRHYETIQGNVDSLAPWRVQLSVVPGPEKQLEVQAEISGGTLDKAVHPSVRMLPGQTGGIQVGEMIMGKDGKKLDRTLKVDLTPSNGC